MILFLLLAACAFTCMGQIAQKIAVECWRGGITPLATKLRTPWLWIALACLGLGLLIWLLVLQHVEVGVAYPMLGLNFVLITIVARFGFKETVDARHWFGVVLVICGVLLLGWQA